MSPTMILMSTLVPALVAALALGLALIAGRFEERLAPGVLALGVACAYMIGHQAIIAPMFPPIDARSWLFVLAPAAAALVLLAGLSGFTGRRAFLVVAAIGTPFALLRPLLAREGNTAAEQAQALVLAILIALAALGYERLVDRASPATALAISAGSAGVVVGVLIFSATALFGQLAGVLAFALTPLFLYALRRESGPLLTPLSILVASLLGALVGAGKVYADMSGVSAVLALAGLPIAALAAPFFETRFRPIVRFVLLAALGLLPPLIALGLTYRSYEPSPY